MANPTKQTYDQDGNMTETVMTNAEFENWKKAIDEANAYLLPKS